MMMIERMAINQKPHSYSDQRLAVRPIGPSLKERHVFSITHAFRLQQMKGMVMLALTPIHNSVMNSPSGLVPRYNPKQEARHTDLPRCMACYGTLIVNCPACHGEGQIMTRNQFIHMYLSAPCGSGDNGRGVGYVLPLVHVGATAHVNWLADLIYHARDLSGQPLCIEQLLEIFDNIQYWAGDDGFEPGAAYWRIGCITIMGMIQDQLTALLPEIGGGDVHDC
jgi:hypothetical protein